MTESKRGGAGRGQGRKALAAKLRKVRPFKAADLSEKENQHESRI